MSKVPAGLKYSKDHEWIRLEGDKAYVGITDHAQDALGEIVYVELPPVGEAYDADEEIANIESVKAASAIYNPAAGTVAEVNEALDGSPELINTDCYENYLYVLSGVSATALDGLMDASAYEEYLKTL
ncbi:MAG: glycine cleavage system protein GcvH [Sphaerochaetaceae bacterium]